MYSKPLLTKRNPLQLTMKAEEYHKRRKLVVLILVGILYSGSVAYFFQSLPTAKLTSDFFPRWHASRMLLTAERSVYDWVNATEVSAVTGWPHLEQLGYYYPAYLLIFTAPLSILPYGIAHILWTMFGLWCLWLGMVILARLLLPDLLLNRLTVLLIFVTASVPVFQHALYAQFNSLGVLALALTYHALYRQKNFRAGLWAGGLLFKPQAMLIPLLVILLWTAFERKRRSFWAGLGLISIMFWGVAELLEPNWVISFWQTLGSYVPVTSIVDKIWNPYQIVSLTLLGLTLWLTYRLRDVSAGAIPFVGLLAWTINLNALIIPLFGMMHMVSMGLVFVMLLGGFATRYPAVSEWVWFGIIGLLVAGLMTFIIPLIMVGPTGLQITVTEWVYRFTMPILLGLASLPLMANMSAWYSLSQKQVVT